MNVNRGVEPISIKDASDYLNRKVNLLGVVLEFSPPRKSRGTDYVSTLRIVDEPQQGPELSVNIFTETIDDLPHVRSYGDLIFLKNVVIKCTDDKVRAVFYKNSSSFALFDGTPGTDVTGYQSSPRFHLVDSEKDFICRARQWANGVIFSSGSSEYLVTLNNISANADFDLICMVSHVSYEAAEDAWLLFVWDGNDAPPLNLQGKLEDEEQNPLPLHIESSPLDPVTLKRFRSIGTVLRVTADKAHENFGQHFTAIDRWLRIRNVTCQVSSGMWHGFLQPYSKFRLISTHDEILWDYRRKFNQRFHGDNGCLPQWINLSSHFSTVIDGSDGTFVTLMGILTHDKVNVRLCSIVRVVAILPSQAKDIIPSNGSSEYRMRLTLEDPTARIHAFLCGEEWVKFFGGCHEVDELTRKLKTLVGVSQHQSGEDENGDGDDDSRNPPWIKCCIHLKRSNGIGNTQYYICSTRLVVQ